MHPSSSSKLRIPTAKPHHPSLTTRTPDITTPPSTLSLVSQPSVYHTFTITSTVQHHLTTRHSTSLVSNPRNQPHLDAPPPLSHPSTKYSYPRPTCSVAQSTSRICPPTPDRTADRSRIGTVTATRNPRTTLSSTESPVFQLPSKLCESRHPSVLISGTRARAALLTTPRPCGQMPRVTS